MPADGDLAAAKVDAAALAALAETDLTGYDAWGIPAAQMMQVALHSVEGEIARLSGDLPGAVAQFSLAADIEQRLPYMEPAYWHRPVSHLLGAALLESGRAEEAEEVYAESLRHYRRDGWALYGLAQAQTAQGKDAEAAQTMTAFDAAWARADTKLEGSRL